MSTRSRRTGSLTCARTVLVVGVDGRGGEALSGFTECHWSNPAIARKELRSVGLRIVSYAGVESFLSGMGPLLEPLSRCESGVYDNLVEVAAETAELPQFRDATDHLHFVVER
jgi:S-adenosylmethionine-dependent methyltransferase